MSLSKRVQRLVREIARLDAKIKHLNKFGYDRDMRDYVHYVELQRLLEWILEHLALELEHIDEENRLRVKKDKQ